MDVLYEIVKALWHQDFAALANPKVIWLVYGVMFLTLLLENGLLPAAFLPGDSLLLLAGAMVAKGVMNFIPTMIILTVAASLGCWLGYLQGRWLGNTRLVKSWLFHLPEQYHQRAWHLFTRHGLVALLLGRFLAFVRTILPTLAGISGLRNGRFQLFNWLSGLLWVAILVSLGYAISQVPFIKRHEDQMMACLMALPLVMLSIGLIGSIAVVVRSKKAR
ncbi:DedA family protein [Erwinia pyrifoliae]|uniref:Inner membrane protein YghB n=1 Tax=Erwinia pyrifoliae TaxID=79967 RepID=A0ABY5X726_ERWPY|nr:DedA family protein [Erwinia pyrifoliae]AUX71485.1 DedA family protein [Erwinia pyrifoliae]MCA8878304.1 DedA family protein [Erwinia pyrifoliae]MCT2385957.1 DedA family protein [Erwinia pyrifoliae]MCU8588456.1 DedA family protein [Erwinia pyrifoliae]UWS29803.1 DedA family protein [Erwinia pyrifoliae]